MAAYSTKNLVYGRTWLKKVVEALKTDPGAALIVTPKVRLSKDPGFLPSSAATRTALAAQEADFSGYTAGGYSWSMGVPLNLGADAIGYGSNVVPVASEADPFVGNSCYGYWMDDGTDVIASERFPDGTIIFGTPGDYLDLFCGLPFPFEVQVEE